MIIKEKTESSLNIIFDTTKISQYFSNKCKTPTGLCSNIVYQIKCHGCEARYVGETGRHLRTRLLEHSQNSRTSTVKDHNLICDDRKKKLSVEEVKIIAKDFKNTRSRKIREAFEIKADNSLINIRNQRELTDILFLFSE